MPASKLKLTRLANTNFTQAELGRRLTVSPTLISAWELSRVSVPDRYCSLLCQLLEADKSELFPGRFEEEEFEEIGSANLSKNQIHQGG